VQQWRRIEARKTSQADDRGGETASGTDDVGPGKETASR
jgi:hypothetical protein